MSKTGMNNFDSIYFGLFMVLLNVYLKELVSNEWMVYISLTYVIIDLLYYMTNVYKEIADHLNIKVFTIPYKMLVNESGSSSEATANASSESKPSTGDGGMRLRSAARN
jgi:hypothetical protein